MANVITLSDGTTTVSINAGSYYVTAYNMGAAETGADSLTESLDIVVTGASAAAVQTNVRAIESLLEAAKRRVLWQSGPRVYLTVTWDGSADAWRAEIYDGQIDPLTAPGQLWRKAVQITLAITRGPFEGAEVQLSLTNSNGTNNTTGLTVWNHNDSDAGDDNYADIDAAEVTGVLPAPVRVEMVNDTGGALGWSTWWIANNTWNTPASFFAIIEGEDRVAGYGTITANAASSGGNYNAQTVATTLTTHFDIIAARAQYAGGYAFRLLARFSAAVPNAYVTPAIYDSGGTVELGAGNEVQLTSSMERLVDLGVLTIPPGDSATTFGAVRLVLSWRASSSQSIALDFIQMTPAYACRELKQRGLLIGDGEKMVYDEAEERAYMTSGATQYAVFVTRGQPLTVQPGRANRLIFLVTRLTAGAHDITDQWLVKAWFRPRRWSI